MGLGTRAEEYCNVCWDLADVKVWKSPWSNTFLSFSKLLSPTFVDVSIICGSL